MVSTPHNDVSAIYVAKYNKFVDTILGRINRILREKYDPVTVKLANPSTGVKSKTSKPKRRKSSKSRTRKTSQQAATPRLQGDVQESALSANNSSSGAELTLAESVKANPVATTTTATEASTISKQVSIAASTTRSVNPVTAATSSKRKKIKTSPSSSSSTSSSSSSQANKVGTKKKKPASSATTTSNNKIKGTTSTASTASKRPKSKAKATLYGLSSLKRSGDVSVNMMSEHTTIRTKFNLGPLILKVEKEFGRATRKEVRSATATTAEMSGRLSLRVYHGGAATLHSIRVLQPKQMRIESADDHDRTREFVWKRSSHIAHLVSQKLSSAARSMLRPPPAEQQQTTPPIPETQFA